GRACHGPVRSRTPIRTSSLKQRAASRAQGGSNAPGSSTVITARRYRHGLQATTGFLEPSRHKCAKDRTGEPNQEAVRKAAENFSNVAGRGDLFRFGFGA